MSILIAVLLVCVASCMVFLLVRWVEAGLLCLFAVELFSLTFGPNAALVGRLHLSAMDAVSMGLLAAGAIRFVRSLRVIHRSQLLVAGYLVLFAWTFVRGCTANGLLAAANEARGFVGPLAAMLYFADARVDEESLRRSVRLYFLFAAGLCCVMLLAILGLPVGLTGGAYSGADDRVLPSSAAAIIAICAFFALARATYFPRRLGGLLWPGVFFAAAIVLRHRTVWVMLLAGIVALLFVDERLFRRAVPIALITSAAVAGLVVLGGDGLAGASKTSFAQSLSNSDTWQWRVNGWQEYLFDADQTTLTVLAGKPMGSGWWRIDPESHLLETAPPHSEFVTEYLRVGGIGLLLVVLFACWPLWELWRGDRIDTAIYPSCSVWIVVVAMTLVYGITYSIEPESYAVIGLASAMANGGRAAERIDFHSTADEGDQSSPSFAS